MPVLLRDDIEIYYEVFGEGTPFLFCSVTGLDHQAWKFHQVAEFSRDHKVILFDYRGTGKSSKKVQQYSLKMFTDDGARRLINSQHCGQTAAPFCPINHWRAIFLYCPDKICKNSNVAGFGDATRIAALAP